MNLLAPAKINLHLRVAPATSDGFHPLLSWMCTVGLFDKLSIERASGPQIRLRCDDASLRCDETNLVMRAAMAVRESGIAIGQAGSGGRLVEIAGEGGLDIELQKNIPTGGGLGGGSSDAARTVVGLNHFWNLKASVEQLSEISATLGSDVAFFCHGPSSICTGRGQIVRPIAAPAARWVLLILPPIAVPTGPVYRRFDEMLSPADRVDLSAAVASEPKWNDWLPLLANELLPHLVNDLERPAFDLHPALGTLRGKLEQFLGRIVRMSGSGSSLFTLYDDEPGAQAAAEKIRRRPADDAPCRAMAVTLAPRIDDDLAAAE